MVTVTPRPRIRAVRELDTAEQLLEELLPPSGALWTRPDILHRPDWLFRGQSNCADGTIHRLQPSAFRRNAFLRLIPGQVTMPQLSAHEQRQNELGAVMRFAALIDQHGFV